MILPRDPRLNYVCRDPHTESGPLLRFRWTCVFGAPTTGLMGEPGRWAAPPVAALISLSPTALPSPRPWKRAPLRNARAFQFYFSCQMQAPFPLSAAAHFICPAPPPSPDCSALRRGLGTPYLPHRDQAYSADWTKPSEVTKGWAETGLGG